MTNPDKSLLREAFKSKRDSLSAGERQTASAAVCTQVWTELIPWMESPLIIGGYSATQNEIRLTALYERLIYSKIRVALPKFNPETHSYEFRQVLDLSTDLIPGPHDIPEPLPGLPLVPLAQITVFLVPAIAFDRQGMRLGRGQGHYDRLLAQAPGRKIGIGYRWQVIDTLPQDPWDIPMSKVITD